MIQIRKSNDRGHFDHGWLNTYHTFSFADYYDERFMHFRHLRVINEDFVAPAEGFDPHPHQDMEILTYIVEGALEHKDSMGNGSMIRPGDIQRMSAGTGVVHSEFNPLKNERVHLLQIWILPEKRGIRPSYEQKTFSQEERSNQLRLVASPNADGGSVKIHQDTRLYASILEEKNILQFENARDRFAWIQLVSGELDINGLLMRAGDGVAIEGQENLRLLARKKAEFLLFDLC